MNQRRIRRAARILLVDALGRVLLFRFTPNDRLPLWATPGGECDAGEDFAIAARRELLEETGIDADPGPQVARRSIDFVTFEGEAVTGEERYFIVRTQDPQIRPHALTASEQVVMQSHRWFTRQDIAAWQETIYPIDLVDLLVEVGLETV
ncbi:MAG: NUDIX domain-containing protein [Sphingomonadales bacterium]|nr:NUDIX domain-containing protein [Sphingomonadales bacterium]MDE2168631.1 NUDIX domain-containing protein [Sphingomonadales bacterium]